MNIVIRTCKESDTEALSQLYYASRRNNFYWEQEAEIKLSDFKISTANEKILVAQVNEHIAGFISVWEADRFIHNLFVDEQYQGLGLAKQLIEKIINLYGKPLTLKCVSKNKKALHFYLKNGWKIIKEEQCEEPYYLMILE